VVKVGVVSVEVSYNTGVVMLEVSLEGECGKGQGFERGKVWLQEIE
jgi:hypothetical protein